MDVVGFQPEVLQNLLAEDQSGCVAFQLGCLYRDGTIEISKDEEKSADLFARAFKLLISAKNNPRATTDLGFLYLDGIAVGQDKPKAFELFTKAAVEHSYTRAQIQIAHMYRRGDAVQQDLEKSRSLLEEAAETNHAIAQYWLGFLLIKEGRVEEGVSKLRLSAEQKFPPAIEKIGLAYTHGIGTTVDFDLAKRYLFTAAAKGMSSAQYALGEMFETGKGQEKDLTKAQEWYNLSGKLLLAKVSYFQHKMVILELQKNWKSWPPPPLVLRLSRCPVLLWYRQPSYRPQRHQEGPLTLLSFPVRLWYRRPSYHPLRRSQEEPLTLLSFPHLLGLVSPLLVSQPTAFIPIITVLLISLWISFKRTRRPGGNKKSAAFHPISAKILISLQINFERTMRLGGNKIILLISLRISF